MGRLVRWQDIRKVYSAPSALRETLLEVGVPREDAASMVLRHGPVKPSWRPQGNAHVLPLL